jgi:hypothetical protein
MGCSLRPARVADFRAQFAVEVGIFRTLATASDAYGCVSQRARPLSRLAAPFGGSTPYHSQRPRVG